MNKVTFEVTPQEGVFVVNALLNCTVKGQDAEFLARLISKLRSTLEAQVQVEQSPAPAE